ncbi:hypothetical protein FACS1894200_03850 [Spirochaetia bacterium]|nr:hypothetical protein FACS1894200_03850 [Spirochaetia bacterium]
MIFLGKTRGLARAGLMGLLLMVFTAVATAQIGGRLGEIAILPFTGGSADEGEGIAEMLSFTQEIIDNFSVKSRTEVVREERAFAQSGMTDADTIVKLGRELKVEYVMAGNITSLGERNLLIVSIIKIDVIRQVAGDYLVYDSLDAINKDKTLLNTIGAKLVELTRGVNDRPDKLALLPVEFTGGANKQEGDTLAQLLAIHLLRNGKYAVYPQTKSLEQVLKSGITRPDEAVRAGAAVNPRLALSVISRKIGSSTRFNAGIIALEDGIQIDGDSELYAGLSDGMEAMELLARELSGKEISPEERNKRMNTVITIIRNMEKAQKKAEEAIARAEEAVARAESIGANAIAQAKEAVVQAKKSIAQAKEAIARADEAIVWAEKARARAEEAIELVDAEACRKAWDRFLNSSGIALGAWGGLGGGDTGDYTYTTATGEEKTSNDTGFSGGGSIELRMYRYFGIETGVNTIKDYVPYTQPGKEEQYESLTTTQIPVLVRLNLHVMDAPITSDGMTMAGIHIAGFAGIGVNVATNASVADSIDPARISFIAGGELGVGFRNFGIFFGGQWNRDIGGGSITIDGASYNYTRNNSILYAALRYYLPFRSSGKN